MRLNSKSEYLKTIDKNLLQNILDRSTSISSAMNIMGILPSRLELRKILKSRITNEGLDLSNSKINILKQNSNRKKIIHNDEIFVEDSKYDGHLVKRRILANNLLEYKCAKCPIIDEYNGQPITLELDHINGINRDHRILNLRFLCPNCHSQQNTSCGKNKPRKITKVCDCGNLMYNYATQCIRCSNALGGIKNRKFNVSKEQLEQLIKELPMTEIGKMFGVSDTAIKKRCRKYEIELKPMRGYWAKHRAK